MSITEVNQVMITWTFSTIQKRCPMWKQIFCYCKPWNFRAVYFSLSAPFQFRDVCVDILQLNPYSHNSFTRFVYIKYQINLIMKDKMITVQHKINTLLVLVHKFFLFQTSRNWNGADSEKYTARKFHGLQ
jgi:hypothetical protein